MASPRITKVMREQIVKDAVAFRFKKEKADLQKQEAKLADLAYKERYSPAQIKAMKFLGKDFLEQRSNINLNIRGMKIDLCFDGYLGHALHGSAYDVSSPFKDREQRLSRTSEHYHPFVPSDSLGDEIEKHVNAIEDLEKTIVAASTQLMAVLESVQSFKKLRAIWPEGEKFYDLYDVDSEKTPNLPAPVIAELNKAFGL